MIHALAYTEPPANTEKLRVAETTMEIFSVMNILYSCCSLFKVKDKIYLFIYLLLIILAAFQWFISASPAHFPTLINAERVSISLFACFFKFIFVFS